MKASQPWHQTPLGAAACWLGSIQLAVPVLVVVALAMGWGTYLESTQDAKVARAAVYGATWFMVLMGLVCVSLVFAVVTRFPWKVRHVGFIVVHASLVALIVGGFMSVKGRVEGHIALEAGKASDTIEMDQECIEIVEHDAGKFKIVGEIDAPVRPGSYTIGGFPIEVVDIWPNVKEDFEITDDGVDPYRAARIQFGPTPQSAIWIGDEGKGDAPVIDGIRIRILASGSDWQPPAPAAPAAGEQSGYTFVLAGKKLPLAQEGQEALPGWKITGIKRFAHAQVVAGGRLEEAAGALPNPAIEVTITDGKGSTEIHTAFEKFPDMTLAKAVQGEAKSGATLAAPAKPGAPAGASEETLVIYGTPPAMRVGYIAPTGEVKLLEHDGAFPWALDLGQRRLTILTQFSKAREQSRFSKAMPSKEPRPALLIKTGPGEPQPLAWKSMLPFNLPGRVAVLRFRPRTVPLPFGLRLDQFRKTDYPGIDMAMAYESDVTVLLPDSTQKRTTISMNAPLAESGWKVYQSGFEGETVSIFSVMKDPGLTLTYIGCTALCVGILITFYGRGLTWGHPGIPGPFTGKEQSHAPFSADSDPVAHPSVAVAGGPASSNPDATLDPAAGRPADPGRRASDAPGYVRA